ncbi:hypothetical protein DIU31_009480 [Mucilaginibacter rubeus]|uniref:Uncharacterized protein n=1 Tax=Mucilaginibacter rubeus TaxID=2027860 RepID=A0AAE6JDP4_9SPHI|nr:MULTISPECIES: hypothetical protein [Mucilaginibacter]QEM03732.1 hypothetical protein DIU31_009480 [Mucilaginibacter rubeus]QTE40890.1 hypothetical protein J3L19_18180 [Mucilaginibacter rubeus]QTE61656.1 hypothetical protein J3L22_24035 [Mucilaginibacter rubeus]
MALPDKDFESIIPTLEILNRPNMIDVKFKFNDQNRDFGLKTFVNYDKERMVFFIQLDNSGILVIEKLSGSSWKQISGGAFDDGFRDAIIEAISKIHLTKIWDDARPLEELPSHYLSF